MLEEDALVSVRLTHFRFKPLFRITNNTAKNKNEDFVVNPEILSLHPLATSLDRYRVMGEIKKYLEFNQVDEKVVTTLLPLFPNIVSLTLWVPKLKDLNAIKTFPIPEQLFLDVDNVEKSYLNALLIRFAPRLKILNSGYTPKADGM